MARSLVITLMSLLWLAACGGGGGTDAVTNPDSGTPGSGSGSESPTGCNTGAIEGGGRNKLSGVVTSVDVAGHLVVGQTNFATTGASIVVDGKPATVASLHKGEVVTVTGTIDATQQTGCAKAVYADASIVGMIGGIDPAHRTIDVLSQTVQVRADTLFASEDGSTLDFVSLQLEDTVRVSGVPADGTIVATRIERVTAAESYFVSGNVSQLETLGSHFSINGIGVTYDQAQLVNFPEGQLHEGDAVRVSGKDLAFGDFEGEKMFLRPALVEYIDYLTPISVAPSTTAVAVGEQVQFRATIRTDSNAVVTWSVLDSNDNACDPTDCGSIDSTGLYTAPMVVHVAPGVLVRATTAQGSVTATIFVYARPTALALIPSSTTLGAGDIKRFMVYTATAAPWGAEPQVEWTLDGQGCTGSGCGTIDSIGVYRAPDVLPAPAIVKVTARDATNSSVFGSATVHLGSNPYNAQLNGHYAFSLTGFDGDGHSMVIGGLEASGSGWAHGVQFVNGQMVNSQASVDGYYSIDADGRGFLAGYFPQDGVQGMSLALADVVDGIAQTVRVTSHVGDRVFTGIMRRQNVADFSTSKLEGDFAFGLQGEGNTGTFQLLLNGRFTVSQGQITAGQVDVSNGGTLSTAQSMTGQLRPEVGEYGEVRVDVSIASLPEVTQFVGLIVSADEVLLMQNDPRSTARVPGIAGELLRQTGAPFTDQALQGATVACLAGIGGPPVVMRHASIAASRLESHSVQAGASDWFEDHTAAASYSVAANGRATLTFDGNAGTQRLYLVEPGKAFVIDSSSRSGMLYAQQPTGTVLDGRFAFGSLPSSMNWWISATSGALHADPAGSFAGTLDGVASDRAVAGSYTLGDEGSLYMLASPGSPMFGGARFYMVSSTFGVGITGNNFGFLDGCSVLQR